MARPYKTGLDYFELDCYLDEKIRLIQAEFGLKGFAVIVLLFKEIYGGQGYYMNWDKERLLLLVSENGIAEGDTNLIWEISQACVRRVFSPLNFLKSIKSSHPGNQKRYSCSSPGAEKLRRRKSTSLLIVPKKVNVDNNSINAGNNSINVSKVHREEREKKRREYKGCRQHFGR